MVVVDEESPQSTVALFTVPKSGRLTVVPLHDGALVLIWIAIEVEGTLATAGLEKRTPASRRAIARNALPKVIPRRRPACPLARVTRRNQIGELVALVSPFSGLRSQYPIGWLGTATSASSDKSTFYRKATERLAACDRAEGPWLVPTGAPIESRGTSG